VQVDLDLYPPTGAENMTSEEGEIAEVLDKKNRRRRNLIKGAERVPAESTSVPQSFTLKEIIDQALKKHKMDGIPAKMQTPSEQS
jgi:hypothetical protein